MSLRTQKAMKGYISLILVLMAGICFVPQAEGVPRFDKTLHQCHTYRPCVRDYNRRSYCYHKGGLNQTKCYIQYAAYYYSQSPGLALRVSGCETGGTYNPRVVSRNQYHYKGLFQFLSSTWITTPFAHRSYFSAKYNSLAAMWMWKVGRSGEWGGCL